MSEPGEILPYCGGKYCFESITKQNAEIAAQAARIEELEELVYVRDNLIGDEIRSRLALQSKAEEAERALEACREAMMMAHKIENGECPDFCPGCEAADKAIAIIDAQLPRKGGAE